MGRLLTYQCDNGSYDSRGDDRTVDVNVALDVDESTLRINFHVIRLINESLGGVVSTDALASVGVWSIWYFRFTVRPFVHMEFLHGQIILLYPPPPLSLSHWSLMVAFTRLSQPHHHCCHPDLNPPPWLSPILGLFAPLLRPDPAPPPDPGRQSSQWWFWCWRPNGCGWVLPGGDMWKVPQEAPRLIKVWYLHRPVLTILPGN